MTMALEYLEQELAKAITMKNHHINGVQEYTDKISKLHDAISSLNPPKTLEMKEMK